LDQAIDRCGRPTSKEDKGYDSAVAVLELLHLRKKS
jgi:6,7-dimethyl-8-ribityllumazine synthase